MLNGLTINPNSLNEFRKSHGFRCLFFYETIICIKKQASKHGQLILLALGRTTCASLDQQRQRKRYPGSSQILCCLSLSHFGLSLSLSLSLPVSDFSFSHSLSLSLSFSPYFCVTISLSLSLPLSPWQSLSLSLCFSLSFSLSLSVSLSLFLSLSLCLSLSLSLSLSVSLSLSLSLVPGNYWIWHCIPWDSTMETTEFMWIQDYNETLKSIEKMTLEIK